MHLQTDPSLAEVPGFTREQLDALARSVELRRQQLEHGIEEYIKKRQEELRSYEHELLAHHRMESPPSADKECGGHAGNTGTCPAPTVPSASSAPSAPSATSAHSALSPPDTRKHEPEVQAKRTKQTRLQKREKELYGLVTPVFLPLLDARETSPKHEMKQPKPQQQRAEDAPTPVQPEHATSAREAEKSRENRKPRREHAEMEGGAAVAHGKEPAHAELPKKPKRTAKKSALRQNNTSRSRRKRVSLVIDGQTVLPADTVIEPPLTSPSSEATSASNSTASLDDMIDPRLTAVDPHIRTEHYEAVHHSLPLPMSNNLHSPTKPLIETPNSITSETTPYRSAATPTPLPAYIPPSFANHSFLEPSPTHPASLPATSTADPIFADDPTPNAGPQALEPESSFKTYVGGLHGSGTDDVDQAGSYGYPSSLGASYLESYMQSRPLRVRMDAADKAGLDEREKKVMMSAGMKEKKYGDEGDVEMAEDEQSTKRDAEGDEDMDFMGEMEDF